jgi:hypothetical protein
MGLPVEHLTLLRQQDFLVPAHEGWDERERLLLRRYGRWLEALATGALRPLTPEQEHFVRVCKGVEAPATDFERVWVKLTRLRAAAAESPAHTTCVGPLEASGRCIRLAEARRAAAAVHDEHEQRRAAVLEVVRAQLEAIDAEFAERLDAADEEVRRLESEVKEAVLQAGESVKHDGIHVVFNRGRVTWDGPGLSRYAETHPELHEFRKVGVPFASIRYPTAERGSQAAQEGQA